MELDSLLGSQRWKILEIISKKPSSPLEISKDLKTSIAYISQQLKLLEAAGFVIKEKTGSSQKGKPRNIYFLSKDFLQITLVARGEVDKKFLKVNKLRKSTLRIWSITDEKLSSVVERVFWAVSEFLEEIKCVYLDLSEGKERILIFSDSAKVRQKESSLTKIVNSKVKIEFYESDKFSISKFSNLHLIYESSSSAAGGKNE